MTSANELKLCGLCGFAGVGKDSAAANMPGWQRFAFADPLKLDLQFILEGVGCDIRRQADKEKARPLLVAWGATARAFNPKYWIERLFRDIDFWVSHRTVESRVVITDCRYSNEIKEVKSRGGMVVRILRSEYGPKNEEERQSFEEIDRDWPDLPVVLNNATPKDLGAAILLVAGV